MKAEITIKNGVIVIIPEDLDSMDRFWAELDNCPQESKLNCRIACYDGYENALEVSMWNKK